MTNMFVADDTLYVYDYANARLGSFAENTQGEMEYVTSLDIKVIENGITRGVLKSRNYYVVEGYTREEDGSQSGFLALLDKNGGVVNSNVMPLRGADLVPVSFMGNTFMARRPFPRSTHYRLTADDYFYHGWNGDAAITLTNIYGEEINTIQTVIDYRQVTSSDISSLDYPEDYMQRIREHIPDTRPAFDNMLVDDRQQVWLNLGSIEQEGLDKWIILDQDSNITGSFDMVQTVTFYLIQDGKMFGIDRAEDIQTVVVYGFD